MSRRVALTDLALAILSAIVLLVVSPGVAVVAIVAVVVLAALGVDALVRRVRRR